MHRVAEILEIDTVAILLLEGDALARARPEGHRGGG